MIRPLLAPQDVGIEKARPLGLFFDLVFVYAVYEDDVLEPQREARA